MVFVVAAAFTSTDLLLRVELAMVLSAATVVVVAGTLLARELGHPDAHRDDMPEL